MLFRNINTVRNDKDNRYVSHSKKIRENFINIRRNPDRAANGKVVPAEHTCSRELRASLRSAPGKRRSQPAAAPDGSARRRSEK